jgi:hypothetical protein
LKRPLSSSVPPAQPADEIPDFLKAAGWGQSTGEFDESKSLFGDEPVASAESIAQGDLPDWIKAMKPAEPEPAAQQEQEEELPDWINKIGTGALSTSAAAQPDWMDQPAQDQPSFAAPADEEPDWMKGFDQSAQPSEEQPGWMKGLGSESDLAPEPAQTDTPDWLTGPGIAPEATASTDEPDWLKGLGESDSAPEPAPTDTPDWLTGLGNEPETTASSDELDWLKGIGEADITPQPAQTETPDWLKEPGNEPEPAAAAQSDDLDWLKDIGSEPQAAPAVSADDDSEWLKQFGAQTDPMASISDDSKDFDFLNELTQEPVLQTPQTDKIDDLGKSAQEQDDSFAWLENLAAKQGATEGLLTKPEERLEDEPEWVKQAKGISSEPSAPLQPAANVEELGKSEQEQDDSFAWLEGLAAKQGASEGLLTKPEERLEEEPEWVRQAKGLTSEPVSSRPPVNAEELGKSEQERDDSFAWLENLAAKQGATEGLLTKPEERLQEEPEWVKQAKSVMPSEPSVTQQPTVTEPPASIEELGKSEQEQDDSSAWLESLAAKQGASEGLLTEPEERLEEEPEWANQSKSIASELPIAQPPAASVEELGKSEQEQDDSFAWLESLAAKQGASEGLLTKPEERLEEEPEWVKQAKDINAQQTIVSAPESEPVAEESATDEAPAWLKGLDEEQEQPAPVPVDETPAWLKGLNEEDEQPEPAADETATWLKGLDQTESASAEAAAEPVLEQPSAVDETPAWLKGLDEEEKRPGPAVDETAMWLQSLDQPETVSAKPADDDMPAWMQNIEQPEALAAEPAIPAEESLPSRESELPSWLSELEKEEASITPPANAEDLPAWLRDDTGELIAEPEKIEPTRATDWKPVDEPRQPEIIYSPPLDEPKEPEIVYSPPLEEVPQPEPEKPLPPVSFETPQQEPVAPPVQEQPRPEPRPVRKAPSKPMPAPEPAARPRGTGMLVMPGVDQTLGAARSELSRSNIPGALDSYAKLIKKGRFLDEVIYDLRDALYRYPVEVSIWQSLGDAYMRANRLQDALDAYTKAEELLR